MVQVYFVYYKNKTNTFNIVYKKSKNNEHIIQGNCVKCSNESQFVSEAEAKRGGFIFTSLL